jgi:nucleoid-associated protein YgaU
MGLFSFIKNAGRKIFGKSTPAAPVVTATDQTVANALRQNRINLLYSLVNSMNQPISNLAIELEGDETIIVSGDADTNAAREKVILALGNVDGIGSVDDRINVLNPEPEAQMYTVVSGDSLSKIAKQFYGNAMRYPEIFEANREVVVNPDLIQPGWVLRIPVQA